MKNFIILLFQLLSFSCFAQKPYTIDMIIEGTEEQNSMFKNIVQKEIEVLLNSRTSIKFNEIYSNFNLKETAEIIQQSAKSNSDMVVTLGLMPSSQLALQNQFFKPSIAGIILSEDVFHLKATKEGTSGIHNFTYIVSPFDVASDLEVLRSIKNYKKLGLIIEQGFVSESNLVADFFKSIIPENELEIITVTGNPKTDVANIPNDVDAIYILPMGNYSQANMEQFFFHVGERGIASFAMMGKEFTNAGALASQAPDNFFSTYARRIALDVLKIYEGKNASELPVYIETLQKDLVINMKTASQIGLTPNFEILNQATLLGLGETASANKISLETVIYEALSKNLSFKAAEENNKIATQDVALAKASLLPQLNANTAAGLADQNQFENKTNNMGSLSYGADLTQLIYSEPVYANIAVQKLLKARTEAATKQTKLDIVLSSAQSYLRYLQAQKILKIRGENVSVTKKNLDISSSKASLGYSGISDVYRLESQLAQNNIDMNTAYSSLEQARYNINQLLNRNQDENFEATDVNLTDGYSVFLSEGLANAVQNEGQVNALIDYFVDLAKNELPELEQLRLAKQVQERLLKSNKRSLFTPQVALSANYNQNYDYFSVPANTPSAFTGTSPTYTIGGRISLPIFQGGTRAANIRKAQHSLNQVELNKENTTNQLEQILRNNFENLSVSYQSVELTKRAAEAAEKNFKIVQDLYQNGQADITTLIDAQNASLQAKLNSNNVLYQLISDLLAVERYTGQYYFLMDNSAKAEYIKEINTYILEK